MARFIPAQLQRWTDGVLLQTPEHKSDVERHYVGVSKDTRTLVPGEAYVALIGPHFNGHAFADEAIAKGATMLVMAADDAHTETVRARVAAGTASFDVLVVDDTLKAFEAIAHGYRQSLAASVVGVTGSVGKTTTRRMIHTMVAPQLKAMETYANLNNEIGLSETLLKAEPDDQVLVTEIAMDHPGEIRLLSSIAAPDIAVITNIGCSHALHLGSVGRILEEKTSIIDAMKDNALCIVNGDDVRLAAWATTKTRPLSTWFVASEANTGQLERSGGPVFWAESIESDATHTTFVARSSFAAEHRWPMMIPAPGRHLVEAALFGMASAYALGLDMDKAAASAVHFQNTGDRLRLVEANGVTIISDCYNASPASMRVALDVAATMRHARRLITVIGGMCELGKYSEHEHRVLARDLAALKPDRVFLTGEEAAPTYEMLLTLMDGSRVTYTVDASDDFVAEVLAATQAGDLVVVKGSRRYTLERVTAALSQEVVSCRS